MAKTSNNNQGGRFQRTQQQPQQEIPQPPQREPQPKYVFRISWLLVPLCVLGMWYLLSHSQAVLEWKTVCDILRLENYESYSRLAILCLVLIFIVAAIRILGRKNDE